MKIEVVTLFPRMIAGTLEFGVVGRAIARGLLSVGSEDPRAHTSDVHRTVDDRPYGGGPGMVMKPELLIAGRYEGVDERVIELGTDRELSVGDYVLSGGELPALTVIDAVARLLPGALGDERSSGEDSFSEGLLDWPHYTRPEVFEGRAVPAVLLSGNHADIGRWRLQQAVARTWLRRPDLIARHGLTPEAQRFLSEFLAAGAA